MKRVRVFCSFIVEIEMTEEEYERRFFIIEDNGCPTTGIVGAKLNEVLNECEEKGICWACRLSGQNRIICDAETTCRHVAMPEGRK